MKSTHVGSLPFLSINQALDYTFKYDVPVLPTLPRFDDKQFIGADVVYMLDLGKFDDRRMLLNDDFHKSTKELIPFWANDFFARFKGSGKDEFKYQSIGPISFYTMAKKNKKVDFKVVYDLLMTKYSSLLKQLKNEGDFLFVLDEPLLFEDFQNTYPALESFCEELKGIHSNLAIHCCGKLSIFQLNQCTTPMSIDFNLYSEEEILQLKNEIIPGVTYLEEEPEYLKLIREGKISAKYITPSCGLAYKTLDEVDIILDNLIKLTSR